MIRKSEFNGNSNFIKDAKIVAVDLEVSPSLMYAYGYYDPKVIKVVEQPKLLSVAWKWLGESKTYCETLADFNSVGKNNDKPLIERLWQLMNDCHIFLAYNGDSFDYKVANTFFVQNGMNPPSPCKRIDPIKYARRYFKFNCNKLDYVGKLLLGEGKTEATYGDCWEDLMFGDKKARKKADKLMKIYNKNDVDILEKIYLKLRPWADNHPNLALMSGHDSVCPRCGRNEGFRLSKYRYTGAQINAVQYQCKSCGSYITRRLDKEEREALDEEGKLRPIFRNLPA